ncbi:hypothetical protein GQ55_2G090100 [Panicum hallii var. hallii]|uniref:Uncharacterized protein n=1 Tax=Panicum hallii var. hallii TaxID=1504633 RepID=A0A2T7EN06_9POAL|nr:hypothetical protein GQ55_2G090100 [Panicum hallii var. hallii]
MVGGFMFRSLVFFSWIPECRRVRAPSHRAYRSCRCLDGALSNTTGISLSEEPRRSHDSRTIASMDSSAVSFSGRSEVGNKVQFSLLSFYMILIRVSIKTLFHHYPTPDSMFLRSEATNFSPN